MAKDHEKGSGQPTLQVVQAAPAAPETIALPVADVVLLQAAAAEVPALRASKEAAEAALAVANREAVEYLRIAEADAGAQRVRGDDLARQLDRERARADSLAEQCQGLINDLSGIQLQLTRATATSREAAEVEPLQTGHRRVITVQPYRFDAAQGPKSSPKGTVMQVPEKDYLADQLRRFPHLRDHAEYAAEQTKNAKRDAMPVDHASRNLEAVHARVADVLRIRELQREELARRLIDPAFIASQIPR